MIITTIQLLQLYLNMSKLNFDETHSNKPNIFEQ